LIQRRVLLDLIRRKLDGKSSFGKQYEKDNSEKKSVFLRHHSSKKMHKTWLKTK
jgi:hypothetical protein